jgi:hypothetical protein
MIVTDMMRDQVIEALADGSVLSVGMVGARIGNTNREDVLRVLVDLQHRGLARYLGEREMRIEVGPLEYQRLRIRAWSRDDSFKAATDPFYRATWDSAHLFMMNATGDPDVRVQDSTVMDLRDTLLRMRDLGAEMTSRQQDEIQAMLNRTRGLDTPVVLVTPPLPSDETLEIWAITDLTSPTAKRVKVGTVHLRLELHDAFEPFEEIPVLAETIRFTPRRMVLDSETASGRNAWASSVVLSKAGQMGEEPDVQ